MKKSKTKCFWMERDFFVAVFFILLKIQNQKLSFKKKKKCGGWENGDGKGGTVLPRSEKNKEGNPKKKRVNSKERKLFYTKQSHLFSF